IAFAPRPGARASAPRRGSLRSVRASPTREGGHLAVDPRSNTPVVGMIGAGQLARMTHQAAIALGQSLRVLAVSSTDPAALVCPDTRLGAPDDAAALAAFL